SRRNSPRPRPAGTGLARVILRFAALATPARCTTPVVSAGTCHPGHTMTTPALPRSSGVLLHPTSLPGPFGIGDLGPTAYRWVETLAAMRQSWWQVLPLGPTGAGDSPYQSFSAFAGNVNLLSPELLEREGLISS